MAEESGCDAVHPGYGFLSESASFARACGDAGLTFVGPSPRVLELFGDKTAARALAEGAGVPILPGTSAASLDEARAFFASLGNAAGAMVKAVAGGGGRGLRIVTSIDGLADAFARCSSEAASAFGRGDVYVERLLPRAAHVEVQLAGDRRGSVGHGWERDCTLQRRNQKLVEFAPATGLRDDLRERIISAALRIAAAAQLDNVATCEFLIDLDARGDDEPFYFIEANPRLQVEHTVTEEITGVDLVAAQLRIANGETLAAVGLAEPPPRHGMAVQLRINAETLLADGSLRPASGTITMIEPPTGAGIRIETAASAGHIANAAFDSLLSKLVVHTLSPDVASLLDRAGRALDEYRIEGITTGLPLLRAIIEHRDVRAGRATTRFIDDRIAELAAAADDLALPATGPGAASPRLAGARIDALDPLAVLHHGKSAVVQPDASFAEAALAPGTIAVRAPMQGTVIAVDVAAGDLVRAGQRLLVMEAMKMEHAVDAPAAGRVLSVIVSVGEAVFEGAVLVLLAEEDIDAATEEDAAATADLDAVRPDLAEVQERHATGLDAAREDAVARRRRTRQRTARENVADLVDPGSFVEYGPLVIAAQRRRRPVAELIERTPADGLIGGIGTVNAELFGSERARCIAMSYDYTVLAGTQGQQNHRKKDRLFELAKKWRLPIVFLTEGGGGRPGDTDGVGVAGLDCMAFNYFGQLSGLVPLVGIVSGRCFAGNAALLGCCDVVIATRNANIGMGGPAMVEGGGLGVFRPEEIGPMEVQARNGVVDIAVDDEAEAVQAAKRYLSYFQGAVPDWRCADQRHLRSLIPENRRRVYDVRAVVEAMADEGSVLELRRGFGAGMVTALARVEGRSIGVIANNPAHLAGAIDSDGADKASRFMHLCDAFDLPLLFLCDTPGIMVGPEVEKTALVRHASRMFVTGASLSVPFFTIVLRKAYGLGAQAMAGGSFKAPMFTISWPTGEFGGMGLEGAVKLGYRNELAAVDDPQQRRALFDEMVERMYAHGKAVNTASHFEIDDVIDPADSRTWINGALRSVPAPAPRAGKKRPLVDTW